jgi:hypothetical protein
MGGHALEQKPPLVHVLWQVLPQIEYTALLHRGNQKCKEKKI